MASQKAENFAREVQDSFAKLFFAKLMAQLPWVGPTIDEEQFPRSSQMLAPWPLHAPNNIVYESKVGVIKDYFYFSRLGSFF
jgi:hypothetical protein